MISIINYPKLKKKCQIFTPTDIVSKIFRNIENYKNQRALLTATLTEQLFKLENEGYTPEVYQHIISLEKSLDDYLPQEQSTVEKDMDISELRDAVGLLKEANRLLGDGDED